MEKRIRAIIVDDEALARETLALFLYRIHPEIEILGQAENVQKAHDLIREHQPEIVFLDVEMPGGNGFDLLDKFKEDINFKVIFTTAYGHYAIQAIRYASFDYILKPLNPVEIKNAIERYLKYRSGNNQLEVSTLLQNVSEGSGNEQLILPNRNDQVVYKLKNIILLEASGSYTKFYIDGGESILTSKNLKKYEEMLNEDVFVRIHKSHIVNLKYVKRYSKKNHGEVELTDGNIISISRQRKHHFQNKFDAYNSLKA
ncbi:MAG: response regulator transcription factor [Bacteroidetes bacterium]|nr:MAG: response regulator transcription factor [Bacteroidota bacterium]